MLTVIFIEVSRREPWKSGGGGDGYKGAGVRAGVRAEKGVGK